MTGLTRRLKTPAQAPPRERDLWALGVLPVLAAGALFGLIGVYWDIAWHIDIGRDTFFSPPHNFLYASMASVLLVSLYGLWRDQRDTLYHLRVGAWRLHPGVHIVAVGAALVLLFAPLDELWHRLFGLDVTLWAPMHLVGLLGLALATFGGLVSAWLERLLAADEGRRRLFGNVALLFAAILLGWITLFLAEFEFGVPQFPSLWHPLLLTGLPSFVFVLAARLEPRPWSATLVSLAYTAIRLALAGGLIMTASLEMAGHTRPMIPLLVLSALVVDLLARKAPAWLMGLAAGAVTLGVNLVLVRLGDGVVWYDSVVLSAALPGLALAALAGWAGAAVAAALRGPAPRPVEEPA